ncbi:FkbM family methyltransferase [Sphingomonas abietis]|uniref:FkbM family methyltransferase n=1 Tax=Sphingomonas abietis TaxID=3012344 RepID=A0ABY7NMI7_9SPHN|nr:FkbM family methyltransferase [Sphingomonas abietis]WBO22737.1 FkbM family methyltransferase [Sphingomonas abietis]
MKYPSVLSSIASRFHHRSTGDAGIRLFHLDHLRTQSRQRNEAVIRKLCANAYLGNSRSLCRVLGRYKMIVDTTDVGLSSHLLLDGYWEMWLTELLSNLVRPGMTVVDVGANLGYFTLLMADLVGPGGHVHAFEPNTDLARRMTQSLAINGFQNIATVHEQALADTETDVLLVVPTDEPKNGHLLPADHPVSADQMTESRLMRTRRLDSYAELLDADLIKIDADTSELAIWNGMSGILQSGRPLTIVLEFARMRYADPGGFINQIVADGFTLAEITLEAGVQPTTRAAILAAPPTEDVMLLLVR